MTTINNTNKIHWTEWLSKQLIKNYVTVKGYRFINSKELIIFGTTTSSEGDIVYYVLHRTEGLRYPIRTRYNGKFYSFKKLITSNYDEYISYIHDCEESSSGSSYVDGIDHLYIKKLTNGRRFK